MFRTIFRTVLAAMLLAVGATSSQAQPSLPSSFHATTIHSPEGAEIFVRSGGTGHVVVLLHGYAENSDSWAPLAALTVPESDDIAESMVLDGQQAGAIPRWSDENKEDFVMPGDPGPIIVTELYTFGARDFDTHGALDVMYHGATVSSPVRVSPVIARYDRRNHQ